MLRTFTLFLLLACGTSFAVGSHNRKGHIRKDGKYVTPSRATNPDKIRKITTATKETSIRTAEKKAQRIKEKA